MSKTPKRFQAVIIGAGPGGYVAAIRLAQLGVKTAVIERRGLGGVCLNVGCIPSKALIEASKKFDFLKSGAAEMGIQVSDVKVDVGAMQTWKQSVVDKLTGGVGALLKSNGVEILSGSARFVAPDRLEIKSEGGTKTEVEADAIVVATGSRPVEIAGFPFDEKYVLSSTGALSLPRVPKRLLVIGGGYIGLEMGGVYARLGSKVTVVEMAGQLLPGLRRDLVQPVARKLRKLGAEILVNSKALSMERTRATSKVQVQTSDGTTKEITVDAVLVTVGRRPNTEQLDLAAIGIEVDGQGFIPVDEQLRTQVSGVYAIGDVVGDPLLAHKASKEGEVVAEVIAGHNAAMDVRAIPAVIFTDPEIATVGWSEAEAKAEGHTPVIGKFPFAANGRALTAGKSDGFVRIIADGDSDEVLGVEIVGPNASDLIAEATLGLEMGALTLDMGLTIHAHPTLAEALMEAANATRGQAIHAIHK